MTDPRVLWAAERTLLAWVRTGVSMMGFGYVVARLPGERHPIAMLSGTALAILGGLVNLAATARYRSQLRNVRQGRDPVPDALLPTAVALGSALVGAAFAFSLLR